MRIDTDAARMMWTSLAILVVVAGSVGCSPPPETSDDAGDVSSTGTLVSAASWSRTVAGDDPLAEHRPDSVECPDDASGKEKLNGEPSLSVKTSDCNYYSGQQSLLGPIKKGDQLEARIWHFELTSNEPAQAHVAILLDGDLAWEKNVEIPAESELLNPTWTAQSDYSVGSTVTFHLHNHGANAWNFIELTNNGPPE